MIQGEKVVLRAREPADNELRHRWMNDREVMRYMGMRFPSPLLSLSRAREPEMAHAPQQVRLMIETLDGIAIGTCALMPVANPADRDACLAIMIGEKDYWSQGYGRDVVLTLCSFGFGEMNLHRIHLFVFAYNERGIRCYEKCGFQVEARHRKTCYREGQYHDMLVMSILEDEFRALWPERC